MNTSDIMFYMICEAFWVSAFWCVTVVAILIREANR